MYVGYRLNSVTGTRGGAAPLFKTQWGDIAEVLALAMVEHLSRGNRTPGPRVVVESDAGPDVVFGLRRHVCIEAGRMPLQPEPTRGDDDAA